ncbi:hypothetical protein AAMO2058_000120800 [Amorphochlora amoebiformis]
MPGLFPSLDGRPIARTIGVLTIVAAMYCRVTRSQKLGRHSRITTKLVGYQPRSIRHILRHHRYFSSPTEPRASTPPSDPNPSYNREWGSRKRRYYNQSFPYTSGTSHNAHDHPNGPNGSNGQAGARNGNANEGRSQGTSPITLPFALAEMLRTAFGDERESQDGRKFSLTDTNTLIEPGESRHTEEEIHHYEDESFAQERRVKVERNLMMRGITEAKLGLAQAEEALFRQGEEIYELTHALRMKEAEIVSRYRMEDAWEAERQALRAEIEALRDLVSKSEEQRVETSRGISNTKKSRMGSIKLRQPVNAKKLKTEASDDFQIEGSPADVRRKKFRILSIDGGGIRGVVPAVILRRLAEEQPDFLDSIDLVTGTSTGGLISLMLATGRTPEEIERLYLEECGRIFQTDLRRRANPTRSKYGDAEREAVFESLLGNATMESLQKWTLVTAFRLDGKVMKKKRTFFPSGRWRPSLFTNIPKAKGRVEPDLCLSLLDCAMATSAAPTYFPVYKGYIDGGLFATNPSLCAMSKIFAHFPHVRPEDIVVLSLGCGGQSHKVEVKDSGDWGVAQWTPNLLSLFFDTSELVVSLHMTHMIGERYHRLEPMLENRIEIDEVSSIPTLYEMAEEIDIDDTLHFIRENFLNVGDQAYPAETTSPEPEPHQPSTQTDGSWMTMELPHGPGIQIPGLDDIWSHRDALEVDLDEDDSTFTEVTTHGQASAAINIVNDHGSTSSSLEEKSPENEVSK